MLHRPRHRGWSLLLGMLGLSVLLLIQCTVAVAMPPRHAESPGLCQQSCAPVHVQAVTPVTLTPVVVLPPTCQPSIRLVPQVHAPLISAVWRCLWLSRAPPRAGH